MTSHTDDAFARLGEYVGQLMQETGVPGVAVGVLHKGQMQTAGYGVTNADHPLPVTDRTFFQIGSISKTFTTTALLRLVDRGCYDLDAPVRRYLPEFAVADQDVSARVTLRHLLTHTGGWDGDLFLDTGPGDDALPRYITAMAELPQMAPLGAVFSYNNSGFAVLGRLIELATGQRFEAAMQELALGPLGLEQATYSPGEVMTQRFAVGHDATPQGAKVLAPWGLSRATSPMGGVICHVRDLLCYARFHLGDGTATGGERLLSEASLAAMRTPQATVWDKTFRSLGWSLDDSAGVRQVAHAGGTLGQITLLTLVPERDLAVAVLTNALQGGTIHGRVTRWVLLEYLGVEPAPDPKPIETTPEALKEYVGRYTRYGVEMELGLLLGRLIGQQVAKFGFPTRETPPPSAPPPMTLGLCEPDRLLILDGPGKGAPMDVLRRPDGSVGWLRTSGRIYRRES